MSVVVGLLGDDVHPRGIGVSVLYSNNYFIRLTTLYGIWNGIWNGILDIKHQ